MLPRRIIACILFSFFFRPKVIQFAQWQNYGRRMNGFMALDAIRLSKPISWNQNKIPLFYSSRSGEYRAIVSLIVLLAGLSLNSCWLSF